MHYTLKPLFPDAHLFLVTCRVSTPDAAGQRFSLPAWIPGSYLIRDFSRHIVHIRAEAEGKPVALAKQDKATWQAVPCKGALTLIYQVYAYDVSVRGAYLDRQRAFFNASSVFLRAHGQENAPQQVELLPPDFAPDWQVATSLARAGAAPWGFGAYQAASYADLLDHPVEMGRFIRMEFTADGVSHHLAVTCDAPFQRERLCRDLARICAEQMALFAQPRLAEPYLFLLAATDTGYGGLEHRNASALSAACDDLPAPHLADTQTPENYVRLLGLCSHEYFHRWNVKRIKPVEFVAPDDQREAYSRLLWFFEGVTSYYDDLCLARAGVIDETCYLGLLAKTLSQVRNTPGRAAQSLVESSFDAWIKYYRPDENSPNASVSYYLKGAWVALWLDLRLRQRKGVCLDTLLRRLWQEYGSLEKGLTEADLYAAVAALGGTALARTLQAAVEGTHDLPLERLLTRVGVALAWQAENGGKTPWLGLRHASIEGRIHIRHVLAASPAEQAGLAAGDVLLALAGREVTAQNLESRLARLAVDTPVECHYFRRGLLRATTLTPQTPPANTALLTVLPGKSAREKRREWMGGGKK
ncbi:MAG: PDZ domain-containing protein [Zoogloeaceae bacterium]|jgi:predicted metalloprotease with PDZ domain|nr:PDZ domain-containing protein [Zoogloeaceae bacterium]